MTTPVTALTSYDAAPILPIDAVDDAYQIQQNVASFLRRILMPTSVESSDAAPSTLGSAATLDTTVESAPDITTARLPIPENPSPAVQLAQLLAPKQVDILAPFLANLFGPEMTIQLLLLLTMPQRKRKSTETTAAMNAAVTSLEELMRVFADFGLVGLLGAP